MNIPYLAEILLVVSILVFLVAIYVIIPALWTDQDAKIKRKQALKKMMVIFERV